MIHPKWWGVELEITPEIVHRISFHCKIAWTILNYTFLLSPTPQAFQNCGKNHIGIIDAEDWFLRQLEIWWPTVCGTPCFFAWDLASHSNFWILAVTIIVTYGLPRVKILWKVWDLPKFLCQFCYHPRGKIDSLLFLENDITWQAPQIISFACGV